MLRQYRQFRDPDMFLTSFFKTTPEDITDGEFITLDIERSDEDIAPVLTDISTGSHVNSADIYTNKTIKPPAFGESIPFNVYDLMKRSPGRTEYEEADVNFQAQLRIRVLRSWKKLENKIKRTIELQASQIMTTGTVTLYDANGIARYILDFKPKMSHFPTVSTGWGSEGADPIGDIETTADQIRDDGLCDIRIALMDSVSFKNFLANSRVEKYFKRDGYALGELHPQMRNNGAKYQGSVNIGNYMLDIFTYNARYKDLESGTKTKYIPDNRCILLPDPEDLDFRKCFGGVPIVIESDEMFRDVLPDRVTVPGAVDFKPRIYTDQKAETMFSEVKSRPLLVPASIDRFGCITTAI
jgi:hypothetical protein